MKYESVWKVSGVVTEKRVVTSPKNPNWRMNVAKVMTLGSTFEVQIEDETQFNSIEPTHEYVMGGGLSMVQDRIRLVANVVNRVDADGKPVGSKVA